MQLTKDNILNIDKSKYNELPKEQQDLVIQILKEYGDLGYSKTLEDIWMADYEEIPVDVVTFISDERYLGKSTRQGTSIYPFWMKEYENIFEADGAVQYLASDEVENSTYGANLLKTYRFKSIYNDLEPFLLEKTNNSPDNLTKYLVEWKGNKYSIVKVTPLYIDIQWR